MNLSQAVMNGIRVFFSPIPITIMPASLKRVASLVKSLSLDTIQKPSTFPEYKISIASMIIALSLAFFPVE